MPNRLIIFCMLCSINVPSLVNAQVPPPDPKAEKLLQDSQQLYEDLLAHQQQMKRQTVDDLTLQLQNDILTVWDRLLDEVDNQPQPTSPQQPQSDSRTPDGSDDENRQPQENGSDSEKSPRPMGAGQDPMPDDSGTDPTDPVAGDGGTTTEGPESDNPADRSSDEARQRENDRLVELQQAERDRLMKEVWGRLPPRIRQKLLNASDEQYLPEYEDRIREYFRRLSQPDSR